MLYKLLLEQKDPYPEIKRVHIEGLDSKAHRPWIDMPT